MSARVLLAPKPGFCVKALVEKATVVHQNSQSIHVPYGSKFFVNIAWDKNVPPPPHASEDAIQDAMKSLGDWFVPVVVSDLRQDVDKAGNPAVVTDAVYNTALKQRSLIDPRFKVFLIQLALLRIQSQFSILLSQTFATPNIVSKGKLASRSALIPSSLHPNPSEQSVRRESLIEELSPSNISPDRILKVADASMIGKKVKIPVWSWSEQDARIFITISVPDLVERSRIHTSTLDIETRRLILDIPFLYSLDINLDLSDGDMAQSSRAIHSGNISDTHVQQNLTLKRARDFDVDHAAAEWRVAEGVILVYA